MNGVVELTVGGIKVIKRVPMKYRKYEWPKMVKVNTVNRIFGFVNKERK